MIVTNEYDIVLYDEGDNFYLFMTQIKKTI